MYGFIMAGGIGKRFWPMSSSKKPKQFLRLFGEESMIQMTCNRLQPLIPADKVFVVTNKIQAKLARKDLPQLPEENIIAEPFGKDTAPCITLSALLAFAQDPEAVMVVLPADHLIQDEKGFREILERGATLAAEKDYLITIGINPTRPETGYGYIQLENNSDSSEYLPPTFRKKDIFKVKAFAEKPNLPTAQRFIDSGDFLWNSGIFLWKAKTILAQVEEYIPELFDTLAELGEHINEPTFSKKLLHCYRQVKSISIDYGVMEKSKDVYVMKGNFGWSDVGSWEEFYNLSEKNQEGNVFLGNSVFHDSHNNLIISDKELVTAVGMHNMIVVDTKDVLMLCPRGDSQKVKELVDHLIKLDMKKYL